MPKTGDTPGAGSYMCKGCGRIVNLDDPDDSLPHCPRCSNAEYFKL